MAKKEQQTAAANRPAVNECVEKGIAASKPFVGTPVAGAPILESGLLCNWEKLPKAIKVKTIKTTIIKVTIIKLAEPEASSKSQHHELKPKRNVFGNHLVKPENIHNQLQPVRIEKRLGLGSARFFRL